MCTNCRHIYNPYSRKVVLVKCGKCDACKQERASRSAVRIRNNVSHGTIALFVTLTYTNDYIPFVRRSDLKKNLVDLPVYRNCDCRYVYDRHSGLTRLVKDRKEHVVSYVDASEIVDKNTFHYKSINGLANDCISVNWFPDVQDFYKRLRINLSRHYNYEKYFSFFACVEYGGHTYRAHSHHLLFIPREDETIFRSAVLESWPYADRHRTAKFIEVARDAANYVASYVNSNTSLLPLLQNDKFKQKHSSSKNFGCFLECFSLPKILEKIDQGDLVYYRGKKFDGQSSTVAVPIPKYILHRYFPICKGFSWLDTSQLRSILLSPASVGDVLTDFEYKVNFDGKLIPVVRCCKLINPVYHFTPKDTYKIFVRLENCYQRFHRETGLSRYDYMLYYLRVWPIYYSNLHRLLHEDSLERGIDYSDFYENGNEIMEHRDIAPTLSNFKTLTIDPNKRIDIVQKTNLFKSLYSRLNKQRKVTNYVMTNIGYDV